MNVVPAFLGQKQDAPHLDLRSADPFPEETVILPNGTDGTPLLKKAAAFSARILVDTDRWMYPSCSKGTAWRPVRRFPNSVKKDTLKK